MPNPLPKGRLRNPFPKRGVFPVKKPKTAIQAEVEKLYAEVMDAEAVMSLKLVGWQDARTILQSGLACMTKVAAQEEDREVAMKAAGFLIEYAARQMEREGQLANHGAEIMAQLEALYAKALPERAEPLVEVVDERKERA